MYLSDSDLRLAIDDGRLIVDPPPQKIDPSSIDLHLDEVGQSRIWDVQRLQEDNEGRGDAARELRVARMDYGKISRTYLIPPPTKRESSGDERVLRCDDSVIVRPGGFVLWQTRDVVGTPETNPEFICFIDGKSKRARSGLVVHLTAPTIHAGWSGNITLEITNSGPLDIVLHEGDAVAQIVVAKIISPPRRTMKEAGSGTMRQTDVTGQSDIHSEVAS